VSVTPANTYCSIADVQDILSAACVTLTTDDGPPDAYGNALAKAGNKIDFYLARRYDPTYLATSSLVVDWCAALAAYYLTCRRGNPPPPGIAVLFQGAVEDLKAVQKGQADIPGLALIKSHAPGMSKMRATLRPYARAVVEVSQGTHAAGEAENFHRQADPWDTFGFNTPGYLDFSI